MSSDTRTSERNSEVSSLDLLDRLDVQLKDWREESRSANTRTFIDEAGDVISVMFYDIPPDIPAPISNLAHIWQSTRVGTFFNQGAPISIDACEIDGVPAYETIVKFFRHNGYIFQALITIPFRDFSYVVMIQCRPGAGDNEREYAVRQDAESKGSQWYVDPFGMDFVSPIGANLSDMPQWDERSPSHPLSRIRRHLRAIRHAIRICEPARSAPLFVGPAPQTQGDSIEEIKAVGEIFRVTSEDKARAENAGRELTERTNEILSRCDYSTDTSAVFDERGEWGDGARSLHKKLEQLDIVRKDDKICLVLYAGNIDAQFLDAVRMISAFYAQRDKTPSDVQVPDDMASQSFRHWEFYMSRYAAILGGYTTVAIRRDNFDYERFGIALVEATDSDWAAKMMVLAEMADVIFCASFFSRNTFKEVTHVVGDPRLRKKFIYATDRGRFLYADDQERPWAAGELPILFMKVAERSAQERESNVRKDRHTQ